MNGLLSYASPWASDNTDQTTTKKRTPSIPIKNKTIRKNSNLAIIGGGGTLSSYDENSESSEIVPASYNSLDYIQEKNELRNSRVQEIIQNITNVKTEDTGANLASFAPLPLFSESKPVSRAEYNPVIGSNPNNNDMKNGYIKDTSLLNGNSYYDAYTKRDIPSYLVQSTTNSRIPNVPTNMNMNNGNNNGMVDSILEKLNKMIYLLEEQQKEPGKHVIEEFILYTFLGVFIIFIVDSFSRSGKYIR